MHAIIAVEIDPLDSIVYIQDCRQYSYNTLYNIDTPVEFKTFYSIYDV